MDNYNDMFSGYDQSYEATKENYKQTTGKTITTPDSEETDVLLLQSLISKYNSDSDDGESFLTFLSEQFSSKASLLSYLKRVRKQIKDQALLNVILGMIEELEETKTQEKPKEVSAANQSANVLESNIDPVNVQAMLIKYQDYRLFAARKSSDSNYFPTQKTVDTREFGKLSRDELISCFSADKFYSLTSNQREALFQAVVNDYLLSNGVAPCGVVLKDLPMSKSSICFGQYSPNSGCIYLNKNLFANLESADEANNQYLPYQVLSTLIHEARHRVQFSMLDCPNLGEKDQKVVNSLLHPQSSMSYSQYLSEYDEIDARNAALAYMREAANNQKGSNSLAKFYNLAKEREIKNPKKDISSNMKAYFPDIYNNTYLSSAPTYDSMRAELAEFNDITRGRYKALELAKRKQYNS